ncbi:hypothetical protein BDF19DRAFT_439515 [Syncephalis fuscata]|nr:hypothetical protein BDF19DRAFT_439515 [Syncephalis fuscata]
MEAQYIRENVSKESTILDKLAIFSPKPHKDNYMETLAEDYYTTYLIYPNGNQLIKVCFQDQCQFLTWEMFVFVETDPDFTNIYTQDSQIIDSDNGLLKVQWELFNAHKGQSQCKKILSGHVIVPDLPESKIEVKSYSGRICLVIIGVYVKGYNDVLSYDYEASLSLFILGKFSSNDSPHSIFDTGYYNEQLPIDSSDQGRLLWTRTVNNSFIEDLYSEKLIVVQSCQKLDVLDARDGNLLRSITCPSYSKLTPFLGSLCTIFDENRKKTWFVDMYTGLICNSSTHLTKKQTENDKKVESLGSIETTHLPVPTEDETLECSEYCASSVVIGRLDVKNGVYETYML